MKLSQLYALLLSSFLVFGASLQAQIYVPSFYFTDLEGNGFTNASLVQDKSTMIMLFDPYCDHCDQQAEWIAAAAEEMKHVQFVFVTIEPEKEPIEAFKKRHFGEVDLPNLHFLQDLNFKFEDYFGYTNDAVNIYLYKPGKKQPKYFGKEQKAEVLLKYL